MGARASRFGLYFPFLLLALAAGAWTVWWFILADRIERGVEDAAKDLRAAGYTVTFTPPRVDGWPFRSRVRVDDLRIAAPSGHALAAPRLAAEANAYAPDRWILAAPDGLTLTRGAKGETRVTGRALRASVSGTGRRPPRLVLEFLDPEFAAAQGAEPFPIASAGRLVVNLVPRQAGEAGLLFDLVEARGRPGGVLEGMAEGRPFDLRAEAVVTEAHRLRGPGWSQALSAWSAGGGVLTGVEIGAQAGEDSARASSERLALRPDGRLEGQLGLRLVGGTAPLAGLARAPGADPRAAQAAELTARATAALRGEASFRIDFTDGRTRLGVLDLAPAPKAF